MNWKDDNSNLDNVALALLEKNDKEKPSCCSAPSVHAYFHRYQARKNGSAWVWCSSCGAFSHLDGVPIPVDWKNCDKIDFSRLTAVPRYLEEKKEIVDLHLRQYFAGGKSNE